MACCVGRPIAVDWALSKDRYQKAVSATNTSGTFVLQETFQYCCLVKTIVLLRSVLTVLMKFFCLCMRNTAYFMTIFQFVFKW